MKSHTLKIPANGFVRVAGVGDFISIVEPTNAKVRIKSDNAGSVDLELEQGQSAKLERFNSLRVLNETNADQTVVLAIGMGKLDDARTRGEVSLTANQSAVGLPKLTVSGANMIAANAERARLDLYASESNTAPIFIGSNDGSRGIPLLAGGVYQIAVTGDLDVWASGSQELYAIEII
jgi:hypothetical protein